MTYIMIALGFYVALSLIWSWMFYSELKRGEIHDPGWTKIFLLPLLFVSLFMSMIGK